MEYFPGITTSEFYEIFKGGLLFDTAGIIYVNILYIFLMLVPIPWRKSKVYQNISKWIFVITNSIALLANFIDIVYFRYTNRRTTASVFSEFSEDGNIGKIMINEIINHYILVLLFILVVFTIYKLYNKPIKSKDYQADKSTIKSIVFYYIISIVIFAISVPLCIAGIRGGFAHSTRPITIGNANQYVKKPIETAIVLNTPFSIIRTLGKTVYENPNYFSEEELKQIYSPIFQPKDKEKKELNIVVIILESIGQEYIDYGYAPFLSELQNKGLYFKNSFSNGRKSIDGMPSILSSIPMFIEPYFVTHYATNRVSSIGNELNKLGYHTAFFHGAPNGSMGFQAFAKASGWQEYYGMNEYNNSDDFDGMWAIWDEPFLQYFAKKMSDFKEPFATAVFTASSHHPFNVPKEYESVYKDEGGHPIHKCVRYTDNALKKFFESASKEKWFKNTLFVITADHTNASSHQEFLTDIGAYRVPIIFYQPESELNGCSNVIAQQIDIMPTILNYLNYPTPYIAFGKDLLDESCGNNWAINYNNGVYQFIESDYMIQFDGKRPITAYNFSNDILLQNNILDSIPEKEKMINKCKAIIQEYIERMTKDRLVIE